MERNGGISLKQGQIQDTLDQIFTEDELGQMIRALTEAYFTYKKSGTASDHVHMEQIETALGKMGWVIDEDQPKKIRSLRDYEL